MTWFKKLGAVAVLSLSVIAIAQNSIIEGANGRGMAAARDGRMGAFGFHAALVLHDGQEQLVGNLRLEVRVNRTSPPIVVHMRAPERLAVEGFVARFAGPGKLIVPSATGPRAVEGRVLATVNDKRGPGRPGREPDTIQVRFEPAATDARPFDFAGAVRDGDIRVQDAQ